MCLGTAILWTCRRSSCVSPMRVFCTSSGLRISRAFPMCAYMYRTRTIPLSVIAATRSCGQATHAQPGARRAMYSVSEIPSKRSLASHMVLCQEHCLSASFCHVQHQRLIQSTVWTCALTVRMRELAWFHVRDPAVSTCMTNGCWTDGGLPTCEPQACADLAAQSFRIAMGLCTAFRAQCLALRATLPATWMTLF